MTPGDPQVVAARRLPVLRWFNASRPTTARQRSSMSARGALRIAVGRAEFPITDPPCESDSYVLLTIWSLCATLLLLAGFAVLMLSACVQHS